VIETRYFGTTPKDVAKKASSTGELGPGVQRRRRRRAIQYALVFIGCVLVIDALVGEKGLLAMIEARQQYRQLEQALSAVRAENAQLREEARRLREDPRAIEDIARRELGLMKPGEKLFIVKDIEPPKAR
jgi:cell division protein FtsB